MPATNAAQHTLSYVAYQSNGQCPHCQADLTKRNSCTALEELDEDEMPVLGHISVWNHDPHDICFKCSDGNDHYDADEATEGRVDLTCMSCHTILGW